MWQSQLNFATHCATTSLGISVQHLNDSKIPMIQSIFRFHTYYHIRRILFRLQMPLPYEDGYSQYNNNYLKGEFNSICNEYGADLKALYKGESSSKSWDEKIHNY